MRKLDILVLGATGYTGNWVVKCLAKIFNNVDYDDIRWGISGRSKNKLDGLVKELEEFDTSSLRTFECDIENEQSLLLVLRQTKVVLNCTGPYVVLGERVVKSCIQTGTHYVDISAELHNIQSVYQYYDESAKDANVLIIPACGFIAIPVSTGLLYLEKHFEGELQSVNAYMKIDLPKQAYCPGTKNSLIRCQTWMSIVTKSNLETHKGLKKGTSLKAADVNVKISRVHRRNGLFWFNYSSPDIDIVNMADQYLHETEGKKPLDFKMYTHVPLLVYLLVLPGLILYMLSYFKWYRSLLTKYPRLLSMGYISRDGPSDTMRDETKFSFLFVGKGKSREGNAAIDEHKEMTVKVSGTDPGISTTATCAAFSAITLLRQHSKMPRGGVVMPGAAFKDTDLIHKLSNNGIKYDIVET